MSRMVIGGVFDEPRMARVALELRPSGAFEASPPERRGAATSDDASMAAHAGLIAADIERFMQRRFEGGARTDALSPPPGTPIGNRR